MADNTAAALPIRENNDMFDAIWHDARAMLDEAIGDIESSSATPTPDQKIAIAQIMATLSVSQELSRMIMDEGLSVRIEDAKPAERPRSGKVWGS